MSYRFILTERLFSSTESLVTVWNRQADAQEAEACVGYSCGLLNSHPILVVYVPIYPLPLVPFLRLCLLSHSSDMANFSFLQDQ